MSDGVQRANQGGCLEEEQSRPKERRVEERVSAGSLRAGCWPVLALLPAPPLCPVGIGVGVSGAPSSASLGLPGPDATLTGGRGCRALCGLGKATRQLGLPPATRRGPTADGTHRLPRLLPRDPSQMASHGSKGAAGATPPPSHARPPGSTCPSAVPGGPELGEHRWELVAGRPRRSTPLQPAHQPRDSTSLRGAK